MMMMMMMMAVVSRSCQDPKASAAESILPARMISSQKQQNKMNMYKVNEKCI